jgi:ribonuclease-3
VSSSVPDLELLQRRLGHKFRDSALLRLALAHPSVTLDEAPGTQNNQRLEFLGDAVLQLAITRELYERYPQFGEGPLTKARAHMVNRSSLSEVAKGLDLGVCLILARGEETSGGRSRPSNLSNAFEAIIGAVYLDGGYDAAREMIRRLFASSFEDVNVAPRQINPKGELQEHLQGVAKPAPVYKLENSSGPDHDRMFECSVHVSGEELARGSGKTKREAECQAARAALDRLRAVTPP